MAKPALGRGLSALLGGAQPPSRATAPGSVPLQPTTDPEISSPAEERVRRIPVQDIQPCPYQPRRDFSDEALGELADSIRAQGILQPLIVRRLDNHYELIAGERRWRAARLLKLSDVPVIVRAAKDHEVLELALIENLQRDDLNPIEEAMGYSQLIAQFHLRQEDVADKVGKSRVAVTNALRLLKLPSSIQRYLRDGLVSVGHAKVLLALPGAEQQELAVERVLKETLNVRQTEHLVNRLLKMSAPGSASAHAKPPTTEAHISDLENRLRERFGTKVQLQYRKGKGCIQIRFFTDEDLSRILQITGIDAG